MMTKRSFQLFLGLSLLLPFASCEKVQHEDLSPQDDGLVCFNVATKTPEVERTYRAALFNPDARSISSQGTYCSKLMDKTETMGTGAVWLHPCRVDAAGRPLKTDGTLAASLDEADTDSVYGMRVELSSDYTSMNYDLVASSPAMAFESDGVYRYYEWTPSTEVYISDPVMVNFKGSWLNSRYVYPASENLTLIDRRASLYVHIECGLLEDAYIQRVRILNAVNSARWYLTSGFSASNFNTTTVPLYDCGDEDPMHLVKAYDQSWTSTSVPDLFLPPIDYSQASFAAMRPQIEILMGNVKSNPKRALVTITEPMEPMMHYTYNLFVSKASVDITLTCSGWDNETPVDSHDSEIPVQLSPVNIEGWDNGGSHSSGGWNPSF